MRRGTTPVNNFDVTLDLTTATKIFITYEQNGKNILEKTIDEITITPDKLTVTLSQKDTLKFVPGPVSVQIRAKYADGNTLASNIAKTTAERILKDGVI